MCNTTEQNDQDCNLPGATLVIPPPGSADPTSGLLQRDLSAANSILLDPTASSAHAYVHFDDNLGFHHDDSSTSAISGLMTLYGQPRPDGTAHLLMDVGGTAGDMHFHFSGVDLVTDVDVDVTNITLSGGMEDTGIDFDANGLGTIPPGALALSIQATINGKSVFVTGANQSSLVALVDFKGKSFIVPSFTTSLTGLDLTVQLSGSITNQPPVAEAGPPRSVECTSPSGGTVSLVGSASDPDADDFLSFSWAQGQSFGSPSIVSNSESAVIAAPFSPPSETTDYFFSAEDSHFQISRSQTAVTVVDTVPPTLDVSAAPDCLWPPNHQMVLYQLGSTFQAMASDTCDANPTRSSPPRCSIDSPTTPPS